MEEANRRLTEQLETLNRNYQGVLRRLPPGPEVKPPPPDDETRAPTGTGNAASGTGGRTSPGNETRAPSPGGNDVMGMEGRATPGGGGGPFSGAIGPPADGGERANEGTGGRTDPEESRRSLEPKKRMLGAELDPGPVWRSEDDEFRLEFHNLTQAEYREFTNPNQTTLHSMFFVPRQRWYFTGRATKNMEFYTVINRGYGSLDLLDAFINVNYDSRLQFRIGRMKTPFAYEYWQIAEGDLIAPERSLYVGNLSGNREDGAMFHGQVLDKSAEWALGLFNGPRRSFQDTNNAKDLYAYLNFRPSQYLEGPELLDYFNLGGGYNFGVQQGAIQPDALTTANDETTGTVNANALSPTFLIFNNNVVDNGMRAQWNGHIAWFYRSWMLLAEYEGGYEHFSTGSAGRPIRVPMQGYMVQSWYFITGETLNRRVNVVKPKKDFAIKDGRITGPGAIEVHARFSELNLGNQVFTGGLADGNEWSNSAYIIDTGLNWFPNEYTKVYLDWQHAVFGRPVAVRPGGFASTENLLWFRCQLYF